MIVDLRSDTVTKPTEEMRRAMYEAEVADDSYDGDPTVIRLQQMASETTGMEAALLVTSGTMGNLLGVLCNTISGDEVILGDHSHQFLWEVGGIARLANCVTHTVPYHKGWLDPDEIEEAIRPVGRAVAKTGLICIEDTCNAAGGTAIEPEHIGKINQVAYRYNLPIHMDGARFFNAVVALKRDAVDFTQHLDTLTFCLTKGLGAPFGAMLCGSAPIIEKALRLRQMLGGGLRQAGIMAAAGIVALTSGLARLEEDHDNAKRLALGLNDVFPGCCNPKEVHTNMFFLDTRVLGVQDKALIIQLRKEGILIFPGSPLIRLVTHQDVNPDGIQYVIEVFHRIKKEN